MDTEDALEALRHEWVPPSQPLAPLTYYPLIHPIDGLLYGVERMLGILKCSHPLPSVFGRFATAFRAVIREVRRFPGDYIDYVDLWCLLVDELHTHALSKFSELPGSLNFQVPQRKSLLTRTSHIPPAGKAGYTQGHQVPPNPPD